MVLRPLPLFLVALVVAACERIEPAEPPPVTPQAGAAVEDLPAVAPPPPTPGRTEAATPAPARLVGEAVILAQWEQAGNRRECAPLAFATTGQARGAPRPAEFAGGWGVAFDLPNLGSAYGVAGPGIVASDRDEPDVQEARLREQWPYFRDLGELPQPAFAGFGVEGAAPYPPGNPNGRGVNSLAYVRMGGQVCTYNVWSGLGRRHLETLLDSLRPVPVE